MINLAEAEEHIMSTNSHGNLIKLDYVFHTSNFLYFVMPLI